MAVGSVGEALGDESGVRQLQYLVVPGKPIPKARHQVRLYQGGIVSYTPVKTREFEKAVRAYASHAGVRLQQGDLAAVMLFHTSHVADLSNLVKSLEDGLNKIAWDDDRQVKALLAWKVPCEKGQEKTEVVILDLKQFQKIVAGTLGEILLEAQCRRKEVR